MVGVGDCFGAYAPRNDNRGSGASQWRFHPVIASRRRGNLGESAPLPGWWAIVDDCASFSHRLTVLALQSRLRHFG